MLSISLLGRRRKTPSERHALCLLVHQLRQHLEPITVYLLRVVSDVNEVITTVTVLATAKVEEHHRGYWFAGWAHEDQKISGETSTSSQTKKGFIALALGQCIASRNCQNLVMLRASGSVSSSSSSKLSDLVMGRSMLSGLIAARLRTWLADAFLKSMNTRCPDQLESGSLRFKGQGQFQAFTGDRGCSSAADSSIQK